MGVIAYVEGPLCFYHAALIWGVIRGWTEKSLAIARGRNGCCSVCLPAARWPASTRP